MTGDLAYTEDFEGALDANVTLANTAHATPFGEWARLYQHITDNDKCTENTTCAWLWSDPTLPAYYPDMAFGPGGCVVRNWLDDIIVSPWVSLQHDPRRRGHGALLCGASAASNYSASRIVHELERADPQSRIDNTDTPAPGDSIDVPTPWLHTSTGTSTRQLSPGPRPSGYDVLPRRWGARRSRCSFRVSDCQYDLRALPRRRP